MAERSVSTEPTPDEPTYFQALGRAMRMARAAQGLNRKDVALRSGLSYAYLSDLESGRKRPSSRAIMAIAEALNLRPHELLATADSVAPQLADAGLEPSGRSQPEGEARRSSGKITADDDRRKGLLWELQRVAAGLDASDVHSLLLLAQRLAGAPSADGKNR